MTNEQVVKHLEEMKFFHEKNEKNLEALSIAIRLFNEAGVTGNKWKSLVSNPPKKERVGDIFEIDNEHFETPILAKLACDSNGRNLHFEDMYGSSFAGYINYREVKEI